MSGKQQGGSNGGSMSDEMMGIAFVVVACIAIWFIWTKARNVIVYIAFGLDWVQFKALSLLGLLNPTGNAVLNDIEGYLTKRDETYDPFLVTWDYLTQIEGIVGATMRWPFTIFCVVLTLLAVFKMKGEGFKRQYSLTGKAEETIFRVAGQRIDHKLAQKVIRFLLTITFLKKTLLVEKKEWVSKGISLAHFQAEHWKVVLAGANFDPNKDDPDQAPQKTPMEWMRANNVGLTKREGLDEDAAERAYQQQLGPLWEGLEKAPLHVQAICILAGLNMKRDRKVESLREKLTEIYVLRPATAQKEVAEALAPFLRDKRLVQVINERGAKHAFVNTATIGVYGWGGPMREWGGGEASVLSTSMFRWLKKVDRTLFYCLNNVGRRAFHIEGAGAVAHFFAERVCGGPLAEAHVDEAVEGLAVYIDEQGIMDLEEFFRVKKIQF